MSTGGGTLASNVVHFGRALRRAGIALGPGALLDALQAVAVVDVTSRLEFRAALQATLIKRHEDLEVFDQAFDAYFKDPFGAEQALSLLLPHTTLPAQEPPEALSRRVAEALQRVTERPQAPAPEDLEFDTTLTVSGREVLAKKDFAQMTAEELAAARAAVARLELFNRPLPTRRYRPSTRPGRLDWRGTLRASSRGGGADLVLRYRARRAVPPPLVVLCDISGSMARYTELLLRFVHALCAKRRHVEVFLFGTRLTRVSRALAAKDVDVALAKVSAEAEDFEGGTRITACLTDFHQRWTRRVLGQGAVVLLITDGLDCEPGGELARVADRLQRSCRRLVWLNPLLGYEGFEPRAAGVVALLPHVDEFRPVHNLESFAQLAGALEGREVRASAALARARAQHDRVRALRR